MGKEGELWHLVEAKREDDSPTIFRIRELAPRLDKPRIFVAELPYPVADGSRLPDAPSYRRFATFEEQWLDPACNALGWTPVAVKIEDGSFFVYLYGADDPSALVERLSPFDGALAFFDETDPTWDEYNALRELLEEAKTMAPIDDGDDEAPPLIDDDLIATEDTKPNPRVRRRTKTMKAAVPKNAKPAANTPAKSTATKQPKPANMPAKSTATKQPKPTAKQQSKPAAKKQPKPTAKQQSKPAAKEKPKPKLAAKKKPKPVTTKRR